MVKSLRVWISTVLVVTGLLWLLDAIGLLSAGPVIGRRWPLAIVALGGLAVAAGRRLAPGAVALILIERRHADQPAGVDDVGRVLWPAVAVVAGGGC